MAQLENLYREVIMDHYKNPRNKGLINQSSYSTIHLKNPTCGDDITIQSQVDHDTIQDCRFEGHGCSICCASASILTETMIGKSCADAKQLANQYLNMVRNQPYDESIDLEEAAVFSGIRQFPARTKCASIAWMAFLDTLDKEETPCPQK